MVVWSVITDTNVRTCSNPPNGRELRMEKRRHFRYTTSFENGFVASPLIGTGFGEDSGRRIALVPQA